MAAETKKPLPANPLTNDELNVVFEKLPLGKTLTEREYMGLISTVILGINSRIELLELQNNYNNFLMGEFLPQ
jgi:hypothetical protein